MAPYYHFARPRFTAKLIARWIGRELGRKLAYQEAGEEEEADGCVEVTGRVHVQVGADYLVVCAWADATTLRSWPARPNIPYAFKDLQEALRAYPGPRP